jgi:hypothetical protein
VRADSIDKKRGQHKIVLPYLRNHEAPKWQVRQNNKAGHKAARQCAEAYEDTSQGAIATIRNL